VRTLRYLTASLVAVAGCAPDELLGPDRGDPAQYAFAFPVQFTCGRWWPSAPEPALGLFDVHLPRYTADDPDTGPRREQLQAIVAAGGTIVHSFHVDAVRTILPTLAVPDLVAAKVRGVTVPQDYSISAFVGFRDAIDPTVVTRRGGTVTAVYQSIGAIYAIVQDQVIPGIRAEPAVRYFEHDGGGTCFD